MPSVIAKNEFENLKSQMKKEDLYFKFDGFKINQRWLIDEYVFKIHSYKHEFFLMTDILEGSWTNNYNIISGKLSQKLCYSYLNDDRRNDKAKSLFIILYA